MSGFDRKLKRAKRKPPVRFGRIVQGVFAPGEGAASGIKCAPDRVRMSSALRFLRESGHEQSATEIEKDAKAVASWCPQCERKIDDPVIGIATYHGEKRVAFCCPHCSGPDILAKWEAEGAADG